MRIDLDELAGADGQDDTVFIPNLSCVRILASALAHRPAFDHERVGQRHRLQILHFHPSRQGGDAAQLVYFAHCLVEDGGDDAAVRMSRRPDKARCQLELRDEALALLVENKFHLQASFVGGTASETMVAELDLLFRVTVDSFVPGM